MLIAIDHGNKQVKTVHGNAIVSGVQKSKTRPYGRDVLKYGGSYYTLSAQRIPYQKDKTTDERFFILSLFAIAEEIEAQGAYTSGLMPIDLAIYLIRFEYVISQQIYALFICLHFPGGCAIMGKVSKNTGVCHEQNA